VGEGRSHKEKKGGGRTGGDSGRRCMVGEKGCVEELGRGKGEVGEDH